MENMSKEGPYNLQFSLIADVRLEYDKCDRNLKFYIDVWSENAETGTVWIV
jgi:hypothetical protein